MAVVEATYLCVQYWSAVVYNAEVAVKFSELPRLYTHCNLATEVHPLRSCMYHYCFSFTGTLLISPPGPLRRTEGKNLTVTCRYRGSGAVNLTWIGPAIIQRRVHIISSLSQLLLRFSALSAEDNGTYVCLSNSKTATVEITVESMCAYGCPTRSTLQGKGLVTKDSFPDLSQ